MRSALILAGGRGERFWPWSRPGLPKQLLPLADGKVLLEATLERLAGLVEPERILVLTGRELLDPVTRITAGRARVLAEPVGRNTAPAIGLAALLAQAAGADGAMAVLPADHLVSDLDAFQSDVRTALALAESGDTLVTFGIPPTRPETGYGYIERGAPLPGGSPGVAGAVGGARAFRVRSFREKPDASTATEYVESGDYLWNSGMFFWRPSVVLEALRRHRPALAAGLAGFAPAAAAWARGDAGVLDAALAPAFGLLESISIDYAVMEKAADVAVIEASFEWDDLGSWPAWARRRSRDEHGNVVEGRALALESEGCVVLGGGDRPVVVLGGRDLVVVQQEGGTLVVPLGRADEVRRAVTELEARGWLSRGLGEER